MENLQEKIIEIVSKVSGARIVDIEPKSKLYDNLNIDSIDIIDLAVDIEDHFDIAVEDDDINQWKTVQDVINYIKRQ